MAPQLLLPRPVNLSLDTSVMRVLIVGEKSVYTLIAESLGGAGREEFALAHAELMEHAIDRLGDGTPDVLLLDLTAPDTQDLDALRRVQAVVPDLAVVVLGPDDEPLGHRAILHGAHEYVAKSALDAERISRALRYALDRGAAAAALRASERQRSGARLQTLMEMTRRLSRIQPVDELRSSIVETCGWLLDSRDVTLRPPEDDRSAQESGGRTVVTEVPMTAGERVLGVLAIRREQPLSPEDVEIARAFASQAAVALENNRLYAERQQAYDALADTQQELTQAQKMEAIGRLAGGVAHDFNNLLTVIGGRSELLLTQLRRQDPARNAVELIARTAQRAARVTHQLLAFSRKQILQPRIVDLNTVVEAMTPLLTRVIGERVELRFTPEEALGRVKADPVQLEQVIMNLALNARDAMPAGGRLMLQTANVVLDAAYAARHVGVSAGPHVALVVSDTGIGMDAETKARLFEPFFTTKGPGKGTGLGLATAYGIVKQSGGSIWAYSEPGLGTTFRIYFPRVDAALAERRPDVARGAVHGLETVLVVEDEADLRDLARDILESHGYTVLEAGNAEDAMLLAERHDGPIHALLTDVVMPKTSGPRLAARLAVRRPETKVLYMSGHTDDAIVHHGVLQSGTPFLQKPFAPDELPAKIRALLDG